MWTGKSKIILHGNMFQTFYINIKQTKGSNKYYTALKWPLEIQLKMKSMYYRMERGSTKNIANIIWSFFW